MEEFTDLQRVSEEEFAEEVQGMMATRGWHLFQSELFATSEALNNVQDIGSMETLHEVRGKLAMIGFVLNYQRFMEGEEETSNESS
jgi:hypothetical protein